MFWKQIVFWKCSYFSRVTPIVFCGNSLVSISLCYSGLEQKLFLFWVELVMIQRIIISYTAIISHRLPTKGRKFFKTPSYILFSVHQCSSTLTVSSLWMSLLISNKVSDYDYTSQSTSYILIVIAKSKSLLVLLNREHEVDRDNPFDLCMS